MTPQIAPDVLIVGAGAAGLTLAIDLARRNVSFRLIDKAAIPFVGSRGKGIQPRSQEVFEDLGVLDRMAALGGPYPRARNHTPEGFVDAPVVVESQPRDPTLPYRAPLMLPQNVTEAILRDRLRDFGHEPEFGAELTGFEQDGDGVAARIATRGGDQETRGRYLIGADGGGSFVRRALNIGFPGETLPGRGLVADMRLTGLDREHWHFWNASGGPRLAICPLAGTDLFQLQTGLPEDEDSDLSDTAMAELVSSRTGRSDIVVGEVLWRSVYRMNARLADRYRSGRVLLAGDAAHVHPPTGGQGLNTSIQDAYALGWRLAHVLDGAPDALLDSYEAERQPIASGVLALSTKFLQDARAGGRMRRGAESHELDLGYFDSPLSLERRRKGRLQAGARAPDVLCQGAGGRPISLFHVFRGPQWTLLGYEVDDRQTPIARRPGLSIHTIGQAAELRDPHGEFAAAYDVDPGDWVLVRPDGYVGAIVSAAELKALQSYLTGWGLAARRRS